MCCFHQERATRVSPRPLCLLTDLYWIVQVITSQGRRSGILFPTGLVNVKFVWGKARPFSDIVCWWMVLADVEKVFREMGDGVSLSMMVCVRIPKIRFCFTAYINKTCLAVTADLIQNVMYVCLCVFI